MNQYVAFSRGFVCQFQFHNLDATIALELKTKAQMFRPDTAPQKLLTFLFCLKGKKDTLNSVKAGKKAV